MEWYTHRDFAALMARHKERCRRELMVGLVVRCALTGEKLADLIGEDSEPAVLSHEAAFQKLRMINAVLGGKEIRGATD